LVLLSVRKPRMKKGKMRPIAAAVCCEMSGAEPSPMVAKVLSRCPLPSGMVARN